MSQLSRIRDVKERTLMNRDIAFVRWASILEGISYLLLLFIAMPLKYSFGYPLAVRYTGMAHGFLCILLILSIIKAQRSQKWDISFATLVFMASLVPFGAFWMELRLKKMYP